MNWVLALIFCAPLLILVSFYANGSLSQNFQYHSVFAQKIISGDWFLKSLNLLPTSRFSELFIDQHFGYHLILGLLSFGQDPIIGFRLILICFLGLIWIYHYQQFTSENRQLKLLIYLSLFVLLLPGVSRVFWGRPTIISISALFIVPMIYQIRHESWRAVILLASSFVLALTSFETLFFVAAAGFLQTVLQRSWKNGLLVLIGIVLSLYFPYFNFQKIQYLIDLVLYNTSAENKILEWQPSKFNSFLFLVPLLMFPLSLIQGLGDRTRRYWIILSVGSLAAALFYSRLMPYFVFSSLTLFILVYINRIPNFHYKWNKGWIYVMIPLLVLPFLIGLNLQGRIQLDEWTAHKTKNVTLWLQNSVYKNEKLFNYKWEYWSSLLYYNSNLITEPGFSTFVYEKTNKALPIYLQLRSLEKVQTLELADWEQLLSSFQARLFLIDLKSPVYGYLRSSSLPFVEVFRDDLYAVLRWIHNEDQVFGKFAHARQLATQCIKKWDENCAELTWVSQTDDRAVLAYHLSPELSDAANWFRFKGSVGYLDQLNGTWFSSSEFLFRNLDPLKGPLFVPHFIFPFFKMKGQWQIADRFLFEKDLKQVRKNLDQYFLKRLQKNDKMFYNHDASEDAVVSETRLFLGIYYLCFINQDLCQSQLEQIRDYQKLSLGALSVLGMALKKARMSEEKIQEVAKLVFSRFQQEDGRWYDYRKGYFTPVSDREYMFAVGEALTFLNSVYTWDEKVILQTETEKYLARFMAEKDAFYIRWASSALAFAYLKNPSKQSMIKGSIDALLGLVDRHFIAHEGPVDLLGCYQDPNPLIMAGPFDHRSGLLLEGIAHFESLSAVRSQEVYQRVARGLAKCLSSLQVSPENLDIFKVGQEYLGSFPASPQNPVYRVDVFAHLGVALHLYLGESP